ncbi:MAG: hypothetical protein KC592_17155 [Nitrospira sp.]|nr:hypothetical protein [Nitrospira sp.]
MRFTTLFKIVTGTSMACLLIAGTALGATVEAGHAMSSWIGKGETHEIGNEHVLFHGVLDGVIFIQKREGIIRSPMQAAKMHCPVTMNVDKNTKERNSQGFCVITPNDGTGIVYTLFKCSGSTEECQGEWTHMGGTGQYAGISGTTVFHSRMDIGPKEEGVISGYAVWPNLTYTLP